MFTTSVSTADQAEAVLRFAKQKGWTRIALVTSADAVGQDADQSFGALLAQEAYKDLKFVAQLHFNPSDVSVAAQMANLKAANPQVWIAWATGTPMTMVWRSATQAGIELPSITFGGNMTYDQMERFAAVLPKEFYFTSSQFPMYGSQGFTVDPDVARKQEEMFRAFAEAKLKPDEASVLSWDPATILFDVLNKLPETASAAEIRQTIADLKAQPSVSGLYNYPKTPQRGLSLGECVVSIWDPAAGRWNVVASMADAK
jgi:branched-chain amino acid transport system substrate-binding protein